MSETRHVPDRLGDGEVPGWRVLTAVARGAAHELAGRPLASVAAGAATGASQEQAPPTAELTRAEQAQRDRRDAPQSEMAADAVEIDATDLGLDDVIGRIIGLARAGRPDGH